MEYWVPIFEKIVDSSLWKESDTVIKVFITMLAKKGPDQIVRGNAFEIGSWAKKDEAEVLEALKVLASPDTKRIEKQPFDGRRIQRVPEGWLMLNGKYYEDLMRKQKRKIYNKQKQAEYRSPGYVKKADKKVDHINPTFNGTPDKNGVF